MDEAVENNITQIRCEDELTLQRLLDEELDADASELAFHHLKACHRCSAAFQQLKELKALCESQLGLEDEAEAALTAVTLERARKSIEIGNSRPLTNEVVEPSEAIVGSPFSANKNTVRFREWFSNFNPGTLFRPGIITTAVAVLVIVVGLVFWLRSPATVSAAELLRQSTEADEAIAHSDQVFRRTINLEARVRQSVENSNHEGLALQRRIETWQSADRTVVARRLFDEKGRLLAGEWQRADGSRTVFQQGMQPQIQPATARQPSDLLSPSSIWLLNVSAKDFTALLRQIERARVEQSEGAYLIHYEAPDPSAAGLIKATLVLSKADLHTIEQTLVVKSATGSQTVNAKFIEYRFTETSFERRAPNTVAPAVFEPDPTVLAAFKKDGAGRMKDETHASATSVTEAAAAPAASAELEVEALEKLNRVNAFAGEQLSLTRTSEGLLLVSGIVETSERKAEILRALGDLAKNPAVRIDVNTVSEAQRRLKPSGPGNITIQDVQVAENSIPVEADLRIYFSRKGLVGPALENEIEQFSRRVMAHSGRARSHALALKQIAERFSEADLVAMDPEARVRWRDLIRQHADFFRRELEQLRQQLSPIFPASAVSADADLEIGSDRDLARAAKRLFELASATDSSLRRSFSLSAEKSDAPVRANQFWESFSRAESLATRVGQQ